MRDKHGQETSERVLLADALMRVIAENAKSTTRITLSLSADQIYEICKRMEETHALGLEMEVHVLFFDEHGTAIALTGDTESMKTV